MGLGHLKRCLAIAKELDNLGALVEFLLDDTLYSNTVTSSGFKIAMISEIKTKYEIIIVDKYGLDNQFYSFLKRKCDILVRIDDASPRFDKDEISDVIINGNPYGRSEIYEKAIRKDCKLIVGKDFIPMDRKFCILRDNYKVKGHNKNIVVTFGASDDLRLPKDIMLKIGSSFPQKTIIILNGLNLRNILNCKLKNIKLLPFAEDIQSILAISDIVICSASSICWQLAAVGIPFITFMTALNQKQSFDYIREKKIGIALDQSCIYNGGLERIIDSYTIKRKQELFSKGRDLINCDGSKKIADKLIDLFNK